MVVGGPPPSNGSLPVAGATLGLYQGTIYPQGEVHWQFNPECEPAVFAAAFDNRDPGRIQIGEFSCLFAQCVPDLRLEL